MFVNLTLFIHVHCWIFLTSLLVVHHNLHRVEVAHEVLVVLQLILARTVTENVADRWGEDPPVVTGDGGVKDIAGPMDVVGGHLENITTITDSNFQIVLFIVQSLHSVL